MVRLEATFLATVPAEDLFQFLYGAIGRILRPFNATWEAGFNSYMVRLEDAG